MGAVYREAYTKLLPAGAEVFTPKGERLGPWTDGDGRKRAAKVTMPTDAEHAGVDRAAAPKRESPARGCPRGSKALSTAPNAAR